MRYHDSGKDEFKNALLNGDIFKVSSDVDIALKNMIADKAEETTNIAPAAARRVQVEPENTGRRTTGSKYNVVKRDE